MNIITLKDSNNLEKVVELLKQEGIEFDVEKKQAPFYEFIEDESSWRLNYYAEQNHLAIPKSLIPEIEAKIVEGFEENEILKYDFMDDIVEEAIEECLKEAGLTMKDVGMSEERILELIADNACYSLRIHKDGTVYMAQHGNESDNYNFYATTREAIKDWYETMLNWNEEFPDTMDAEITYIRSAFDLKSRNELIRLDAERYVLKATGKLLKTNEKDKLSGLTVEEKVVARDYDYASRIKNAIRLKDKIQECELVKKDDAIYFVITFA